MNRSASCTWEITQFNFWSLSLPLLGGVEDRVAWVGMGRPNLSILDGCGLSHSHCSPLSSWLTLSCKAAAVDAAAAAAAAGGTRVAPGISEAEVGPALPPPPGRADSRAPMMYTHEPIEQRHQTHTETDTQEAALILTMGLERIYYLFPQCFSVT